MNGGCFSVSGGFVAGWGCDLIYPYPASHQKPPKLLPNCLKWQAKVCDAGKTLPNEEDTKTKTGAPMPTAKEL